MKIHLFKKIELSMTEAVLWLGMAKKMGLPVPQVSILG